MTERSVAGWPSTGSTTCTGTTGPGNIEAADPGALQRRPARQKTQWWYFLVLLFVVVYLLFVLWNESERVRGGMHSFIKKRPTPNYYPYASPQELQARSLRFPLATERVKVYMSSWYAPPCPNALAPALALAASGAMVQYQQIDYNRSTHRRTFLIQEIGRTTGTNTGRIILLAESSIKGDRVFVLDRSSLEQQSEERKGKLPLPAYVADARSTIFPRMDRLYLHSNNSNNKTKRPLPPLLTQWGDSDNLRILRQQKDGSTHTVFEPRIPVIKKIRAVLQSKELERLTNVTCFNNSNDSSRTPSPNSRGSSSLQPIVWQLSSSRHYGALDKVAQSDMLWHNKSNRAVFRGALTGAGPRQPTRKTQAEFCLSAGRCRLVWKHANSTLVDAKLTTLPAATGLNATIDGIEIKGKGLSMRELLGYKAIIMLEGNDVATGFKWALLSNSVLLAPIPTLTAWAMEEQLEPWVHFIPLNTTFDDVEEKMQWIVEHDKEAQQIAYRGSLWMKDLVYHPDVAKDDDFIYNEILRRYMSHFVVSDSLA